MFAWNGCVRSIIAGVLLVGLALAGCDGAEPAGESGEKDDGAEVGSTRAALGFAGGRTVRIEMWGVDPQALEPSGARRWGVDDFARRLEQICQAGAAPNEMRTDLCVGHWAMTIAETVAPLYIGTASSVANAELSIGLARPAYVQFRVSPPSATDAASWALYATRRFQESALEATEYVTQRDSTELSSGDGPEVISLLAEAVSAMMEGAEKASLFVAAAAEANVSQSNASREAHLQAWKGPLDSRLSVARIYVDTPRERFLNSGRVGVYRVSAPGKTSFYSSSSNLLEPYARQGSPVFWAYATSMAGRYDQFLRLHQTGINDYCTPMFDASCLAGTDDEPDAALSYGPNVLLGYFNPDQMGALPFAFADGWGSPLVDSAGLPLASSVGYTAFGYVFRTGLSDKAEEWPVYIEEDLSSDDRIAEELIRTHRLNPFQSGDGVAADLLTVVRRSHQAQLLGRTPAQFVTSLGIEASDLGRAALRIQSETRALGRAIVPIWATSSPRQYTVSPRGGGSPVDAAYLYALSEGSNTDLGQEEAHEDDPHEFPSFDGNADYQFAQRGVLHTAEYVKLALESRVAVHGALPASMQRVGALVGNYTSELSSGRVRVLRRTDRNQSHVLDLEISIPEPTGLDAAALSGAYGVWVGEAGLECALTKQIGGVPCTKDHYRFKGARWVVTPGRAALSLSPSEISPVAFGNAPGASALTSIPLATRLYVLRDDLASPVSLTGFDLRSVNNDIEMETAEYFRSRTFPVISHAMREALERALAADPNAPADAAMGCEGLPTNARVKLEDELIPVNTEDKTDSSFQYYLTQARKAADAADQLGEELIDQGLTMDMRAEDASAELEQLCGGTINVGRLQELACDLNQCDLAELLNTATKLISPEFQSEVEGARDCFGTRENSSPQMAAVGDQALCAWRYKGIGEVTAKYQPCQPCPPGANCPPQCPLLGALKSTRTTSVQEQCEASLASFTQVEAVPVTQTLNLSVTAQDEKPTPADLGMWLQARYILHKDLPTLLAASQDLESVFSTIAYAVKNGQQSREIWGTWATQSNLRNFAVALGYVESNGDLVLTLNNVRWFSVNDVIGQWHFAQTHPGTAVPWPCSALPEVRAACDQYGQDSLLCGACGPGFGPIGLKSRLKKSVEVLKILTGAGWENTYHAASGLRAKDDLLKRGDFAYAGSNPTCAECPPEAEYTVTSLAGDQQLKCHAGEWLKATAHPDIVPDGQLLCSYVNQGKPSGMTPPEPVFLWATGVCGGAKQGCGAIPRFLAGETDSLQWNVLDGGHYVPTWSLNGKSTGSFLTTRFLGISAPSKPAPISARGANVTFHWEPDYVEGTLSGTAVLDALSLAYRVHAMGTGGCDTLWTEVPKINSIHDFGDVRKALNCSADKVERQLTRMFLPGVPSDVIEDLRAGVVTGTFPDHRGEYGDILAQLLGTAQNLNRQTDAVVQAIRDVGLSFDIASTTLQALDLDLESKDLDSYITDLQNQNANIDIDNIELDQKISNLRKGQAIANQLTSCLTATANALPSVSCGFPSGCSTTVAVGAIVAATATCANTGVQIGLESAIGNASAEISQGEKEKVQNEKRRLNAIAQQIQLGKKVTEQDKRLALLQLQQQVLQKADAVNEASTALNETYAQIHSLLTRLDTVRSRARRAASKVAMLDNDDVGRQFNVNTVMRARLNTLRLRYGNARQEAIRAAYLARRALEQKLAIDLSDISKPVGWIPAPSSWVRELCALPAIDYERVRDASAQNNAPESAASGQAGTNTFERGGHNYVNAYVGEYVTKLEQFVEAYRLTYPFQDADDTMVVSLRDEILGIREACDVEGTNLLYQSSSMMGSAWEVGCSGAWCLVPRAAAAEPFICDATNGTGVEPGPSGDRTCRAMGGLRPVELKYGAAQGGLQVPGTGAAESDPPGDSLYWFRADDCTETTLGSGFVASCRDRSNNNRPLIPTAPTQVKLKSVGIGGKPTLENTNTVLQAASSNVTKDTFTVSFVYRLGGTQQPVYYFNPAEALPDGTFRTSYIYAISSLGTSTVQFNWVQNSNLATAPKSAILANAQRATEVRPDIGSIVTLVVDGPRGMKLYVNGALRSTSAMTAPSMKLNGRTMQAANGGSGELAEHLTYARALAPAELTKLHAYLAARYSIPLGAPAIWLDPSDIAAARNGGGTSPVSGYTRALDVIYDRVRGNTIATQTAGTANMPQGPTFFSAGTESKYALSFDGGDTLWTQALGQVVDQPVGNAGNWQPAVDPADYLVTTVARVDNIAGTSGLVDLYVADGALGVQVDAASGAVRLLRYLTASGATTTYSTEGGVVSVGVPFILSMAVTKASNQLALFINGKKNLNLPAISAPTQIVLGSARSQTWVGAIAEYMVHPFGFSDAGVGKLHAEFGSKYGIQTTPVGQSPIVGGNTAPTGSPQYAQAVNVSRGDHWLSWYEKTPCSSATSVRAYVGTQTQPSKEVLATGCIEAPPAGLSPLYGEDRWMAAGWSRRFGLATFEADATTNLVFTLRAAPISGTDPSLQPSALLAGSQLERLASPASVEPNQYFPTDENLSAPLGTCQDSDGDSFRGNGRWTYECEYYCPSVLGTGCESLVDKKELPQRCYWELPFMVTLSDIESGKLIPNGGFARGNFNYRHNSLAVNVVGTAVKNCSDTELASTCYANNFLQFTLHHDDPFRTRDYNGNDVYLPLYPGRIQQGKALLAERYLTNPLSSADRGLLTDYWRTEFRGRPLEGSYTLRVYDTPELDWSKLEDVQLLVNYRYWTRLN